MIFSCSKEFQWVVEVRIVMKKNEIMRIVMKKNEIKFNKNETSRVRGIFKVSNCKMFIYASKPN